MSTSDVQKELDQLRKEVAALSAARKQKESPTTRDDDDAPTDTEQVEKEHAIKGQIEELIKLLQDEIRDMPAVTTLVVFALGIIMGRHLR
jgi:predicted Zn-dependent protease